MIETRFISAFILGLLSSGHCLGMCGGINAALGVSVNAPTAIGKMARLVAYNSGRIVCYTALGFLVAWFGAHFIAQFQFFVPVLRLLAGFVLIAMACYVGQWWMGITAVERVGQKLWQSLQPLIRKLLPIESLSSAFLLGLLWGFLPCGLVYSMLVWTGGSVEVGSNTAASNGATMMLCFGLGTLPSMFLSGMAARELLQVLQRQTVRHVLASFLMVFGLWTIFGIFMHQHG